MPWHRGNKRSKRDIMLYEFSENGNQSVVTLLDRKKTQFKIPVKTAKLSGHQTIVTTVPQQNIRHATTNITQNSS
jgi:hypothetical protein